MAQSFVFIGDKNVGMPLAESIARAGYPNAESIASADVIITMCLNQSVLEDVYFESMGIIANARPGALVIDLSPSSPTLAKEVAAMATINDLKMVEAPVVVRDTMCDAPLSDSQNLIVFAAGEKEAYEEALPILEEIADTVCYCGESGEAQIAKAAITIQQASQIASIVESEALLRATESNQNGCDILNFALGEEMLSPYVESVCRAIQQDDFESRSGYAIEFFFAELDAVLSAADDANLVVPNVESIRSLVQLLASIGGSSLPVSSMKLLYSNEDAAVQYGLDWRRANQGNHDHLHHGQQDCDCHDHEERDEYDAYDDFDLFDDEARFDFDDEYDDWSSN